MQQNQLISILGHGTIQNASENGIVLVFRGKLQIILIINLINGFFRTPKINKLHELIDWVNRNPNWNSTLDSALIKLPLDNSSILSNGLPHLTSLDVREGSPKKSSNSFSGGVG